jgi:hypothetical protein
MPQRAPDKTDATVLNLARSSMSIYVIHHN